MKPEEQRIAIAEFCGAKWWDECSNDPTIKPGKYLTLDDEGWKRPIPDYLTDLNAMQDAWRKLSAIQQDIFATTLGRLTCGSQIDFGATRVNVTTAIFGATAENWAEAFLRTINKWVE